MRNFVCGCMIFVFFTGCTATKSIQLPVRKSDQGGTALYKQAFTYTWQQRDSLVVQQVLSGNIPRFFKKFVPVKVTTYDTLSSSIITGVFYVSPDYLSMGTDDDWVRVNITPMAAQKIADSLGCFLPTTKIVNDINKAAVTRLEPVPLYAFRDSTPTMYHHHLIIEGQRKGRKGLISGIKKDLVITDKLLTARPDRVAIYGWHQLNGKPIQPLYTGHVNWYVDYSHGTRLIYQMMKVGGKWMHYEEVMRHPVLRKLICEGDCSFTKYPYQHP